MAQQPNIELEPSDRPRPEPHPGPARRWKPASKPGVITSPDQVPRGAAFGSPGPDTGFAYRLIRVADLPDRSEELEQVLAALMAARASHFGRAPTVEDFEVAKLVCGIGDGLPAHLAEQRKRWIEATAHERSKGRTAVDETGIDLLHLKPAEVRVRLSHG